MDQDPAIRINEPLVSVLMTCFNRERYIGEAISSVLNSTFKNFELIIVDDRSADNSVAIAQKYAAADSRVKVFINPENLGDYPNRNRAADYATGKYLKYVDADDYIYPWGLELLVQMMERFAESGWGLCSVEPDIDRPFPFQLSPAEAYRYHYKISGFFHKAPLSAIISKKLFDEVGGFSPLRMVGDFDMWHRLAQRSPVTVMPHGIVWFRKHDQQETAIRMKNAGTFQPLYDEVKIKYLTSADCPLSRKEAADFLALEKRRVIKSAIRNFVMLRWGNISTELKKFSILSKPTVLSRNHP